MAHMYPDVFPGKWDPAVPEFEVFQTLRKLPDHYHVLYSKRINGGLFGKPECEIDFIIFNGHDTVICLEVKGGVVAYDGKNRQWSKNGKPDIDFVKQASDASHTLHRAAEFELRNAIVDWALCFPNCSLSSHKGALEIHPAQIIEEGDLLDIETAIKRLEDHVRLKYGKTPGLKGAEPKTLLDRFNRSIGFVQVLGVRLAREAEQIVEVTNEQLEVLADLEANERMLVHGSAGTGKTILAQTFAKRLGQEQKLVLLLFFNRGIASKVRSAFERDGTVTVSTFSSFAKRLVEKLDPTWWEAQTQKDNEFWHTTLPLKLMELPVESLPQFDALIVDEGQDFKPEWFEFLNTLVRKSENFHYTVFLDEKQDIFHHWKQFPCQPPPAKKVLSKNCRNTRQIVDYLNKNFPTKMTSFERSPLGTPIVERAVSDETSEFAAIVEDIKRLTGKEHVKPGAIVVLINSPKEESCLRGVNSIAGFSLQSTYAGYDPAAQRIFYSTIDIFKGLEADVILLALGEKLAPGNVPEALYVQGSRAKHLLYVYKRA
jgi:hypothetical protein